MTTYTLHPDDPKHVVLDALHLLHGRLDDDQTFHPWEDYEYDEQDQTGDPKATEDGYRAVIQLAIDIATADLNGRERPFIDPTAATIEGVTA